MHSPATLACGASTPSSPPPGRVPRKRVWRLMKAAGLQGRHPKAWKRATTPGERPVPAPDLIGRSFTAGKPNQKWCGDITYVKTWDGWA